MHILIVDDDPFVARLLDLQLRNLQLRERGFTGLRACSDGRAALQALAAGDVGLLFCDLQMPGMDGVELVRHLVQLDYGGGLVLISGEDRRILHAAERMARAQRLRVLGALEKPVLPAQLQSVLDRALQALAPDRAPPRRRYPAEALQAALQRGELVNHYQPKVDLGSGQVLGAEALVRWRHPEDGLVQPELFVGTAEQHGLIEQLTGYVLAEALTRVRHWHEHGHDFGVAVNISAASLAALDFPDRIARYAERAGVGLQQLTLEITESQLGDDAATGIDILTRLRLKQVSLAIDDFGTGYSSLAQLRDLPFNELKLDRSFVHGASREPALAAIVRSQLELGRELGLRCVAEGVEDAEDWTFLLAAGCAQAQGFLVSAPLPAAAFDDWLRQWPEQRRRLPRFDA